MSIASEHGDAYFSADKLYRYHLARTWDKQKPRMMFIGLNPSTADHTKLDPTLRRVVGFADREGCGGIMMANLFAFRATRPGDMKAAGDPVGPINDWWLKTAARWASKIVVGWGTHGGFNNRDVQVERLLAGADLLCLGLTGGGHPRHPLYLPKDAPLMTYNKVAV